MCVGGGGGVLFCFVCLFVCFLWSVWQSFLMTNMGKLIFSKLFCEKFY